MWMNIHNIKQRQKAFYEYFIKDDGNDEAKMSSQREVLPTAHFFESEVEDYR